ncbi:MAG TPA: EAL domain-containing protein [Solirubrobacteraceae bacterium]|nr:EAL domain-containing protein [Solirubrobacteraceae bacterium]
MLAVTDDQAGTAGPVRVLLVDSDRRDALLLTELLRARWSEGLVIANAEQFEDAARELIEYGASCVLLSIHSAGDLGPLAYMHTSVPDIPIVVVADRTEEALGVSAMRAGAQDYLIRNELNPDMLGRAISYAVERNRSEVRLAHQALHDPLTGLPNRALFLDRLAVALDRSQRTGAGLAVFFLDIDNFKSINDTRGHAAGDRLLEGMAERLRTMLRPMDTVARFGGDEFTFLFEELASEREALLIAERISHTVAFPIRLDDGDASITVSIGIAMAGGPGVAAETVIREADAAMYRAKAHGRACYELFDESLRQRGMERIEMEAALRGAIERSELRVHYQPKVSLNGSSRLVGFEALVRWDHPERGLIAPSEFMPLAETTGLVLPIGEFVLEAALRELTRWRETKPDVTLSVNLSARQLGDAGLAAALARSLDASGTDPGAVCLEVSEADLTGDLDVARQVLHRLKATGVTLAIDDYGTGHTSLSNLKRLPVDAIKIHESFVDELGRDPDQASIVNAIVELAHALGFGTVAEGVETAVQLEQLRRLGVDGAQGYLFGRPAPADEAEALLDRS